MLAVVINICHHENKYVVIFLLARLERCCHKLMPQIKGLWRKRCTHENKSCCYRVRAYCNNWLLPRKDMCHKTSVVGIGYHHKCSSSRMIDRHGFDASCVKLSPRTKLWQQTHAATRKNMATCHIIVATTRFLATIYFLWQ